MNPGTLQKHRVEMKGIKTVRHRPQEFYRAGTTPAVLKLLDPGLFPCL